MTSACVSIDWAGRPVDIETAWVGTGGAGLAPIVFLHEGLGSVSMWRDFPAQLCRALGRRGLVYSRPGYGRSTPRETGEHWAPDFMHRQAQQVLPALLDALGVTEPVVLFGHSDGGSIALLHAAHQPHRVASVVAVAPHILVEEFGLASIRRARQQYIGGNGSEEGGENGSKKGSGDLRARLARHHDDVDSAFFGWNDVWLSPGFARWQITSDLKYIRCPVLAVQGVDDVYGTMAQIDGIAQAIPGTRLLKLQHCGHSPHRDQPQALTAATADFLLTPTLTPTTTSGDLR